METGDVKLKGTYNQCGLYFSNPEICPKFKRNKYGCYKCSSFKLHGWSHGRTRGGKDYSLYPATGFKVNEVEWEQHYSSAMRKMRV